MTNPRSSPSAAAPPKPIVTRAGRSFWGEAVALVLSFIAAQILIALGLPMDSWVRALLSATGAEISTGQAWWFAASVIVLVLYFASRALRRPAVSPAP